MMHVPSWAHWFLLVTLNTHDGSYVIPVYGYDNDTPRHAVYRSYAGCERVARDWRKQLTSAPEFQVECAPIKRKGTNI